MCSVRGQGSKGFIAVRRSRSLNDFLKLARTGRVNAQCRAGTWRISTCCGIQLLQSLAPAMEGLDIRKVGN